MADTATLSYASSNLKDMVNCLSCHGRYATLYLLVPYASTFLVNIGISSCDPVAVDPVAVDPVAVDPVVIVSFSSQRFLLSSTRSAVPGKSNNH